MKDVLLSIDVGSASLRAALVSVDGRIMATHREDTWLWRTPGRMEQSSDNIWQTLVVTVRELLQKASCPASAVLAIGIDATASQVLLDTDMNPLHLPGNREADILGWMDHRALNQAEDITSLLQQYSSGISNRLIPEMNLPKMLWLKQEHPELWQKCGCILDLYDYLTWKATNQLTRTDYSLVTRDNPDLLSQLELEPGERFRGEHLPLGKAIPGGLCQTAASELGLLPGTPVSTGVVDAFGGTLGVVLAAEEGQISEPSVITKRLSMIVGTSTIYIASSNASMEIDGAWGPLTSVIPGTYHNAVGQTAAGALIDHMIESHPAYSRAHKEASLSGQTIYQHLNQNLQKQAPPEQPLCHLAADLHILPYFAGNRLPHMDMSLSGMMSGLRLDNSEEHLARVYLATIQAIALGARQNLETLTSAGYEFDLLMPSGGLTKNALFMQEHLNAMGLPAAMPQEEDAMLLAGAVTGSVASGVHTSFIEAMQAMNHYRVILNPDPTACEYYDRKYDVYLEMYEDQMKYRKLMQPK